MMLIFFLIFQVNRKSFAETFFIFDSASQEIKDCFDSIYWSMVDSLDTTKILDAEEIKNFYKDFYHRVWKVKKLREFYLKQGFIPPFIIDDHEVFNWQEYQRHIEGKRLQKVMEERRTRVARIKNPKIKEEVRKYYFRGYKEFPETLVVAVKDISYSVHLLPKIPEFSQYDIIKWYRKVDKGWMMELLIFNNPNKEPSLLGNDKAIDENSKDSVYIGMYKVINKEMPYFLLNCVKLQRYKIKKGEYRVISFPFDESQWIVFFSPNNNFNNFILLSYNLPDFYIKRTDTLIYKNTSTEIRKRLISIEKERNIPPEAKVREDYLNDWWIVDKFMGESGEKIDIIMFFKVGKDSSILPLFMYPRTKILFTGGGKIIGRSKDTIKIVYMPPSHIDSLGLRFTIPKVLEPKIVSYSDIALEFLALPTKNKFKRWWYELPQKTKNIFINFSIFSSRILTFLFITVICFLIGFGIMKIRSFKKR